MHKIVNLLTNFLKTYQQSIVLVIGYILVAGLSFGLGQISASTQEAPEIRIEEAFAPLNNTPEPNQNQSVTTNNSTKPDSNNAGDCVGQIKGNINSKNDKVYHLPGTSFYNRTEAEACFKTEVEAKEAGFRKSGS